LIAVENLEEIGFDDKIDITCIDIGNVNFNSAIVVVVV
jgi:hypothetical protein